MNGLAAFTNVFVAPHFYLLGCLGIVDGDDVELNNLHRQVHELASLSNVYLFATEWNRYVAIHQLSKCIVN